MKNPLDPRHKRREALIEELFKRDFHKQRISQKAEDIFSHVEQIDKLIEESAPDFPVEKINKVDLAILRLAVYELTVDKNTPPKVVIDEAVELAKEFGGETSPSFINGALGNIMKGEASTDNRKQKS